MAGACYLAGLVLAVTFAAAGWAKLRAPRATAATFAALGLPAPGGLARGVPLVEFGLALALTVVPVLGAGGALAALAGFSAVLVGPLRAGRDVACGCFGTSGTARVSWVELVRNGLLAGLALAALAGPARPIVPGPAAVVLVGSAVVGGLLVLALCRLRREVGAVWDNRAIWETARPAGGQGAAPAAGPTP